MRVRDFVKKLLEFDQNLQVALSEDEFVSHKTSIDLMISKKDDDACDQRNKDEEPLESFFLSIE